MRENLVAQGQFALHIELIAASSALNSDNLHDQTSRSCSFPMRDIESQRIFHK